MDKIISARCGHLLTRLAGILLLALAIAGCSPKQDSSAESADSSSETATDTAIESGTASSSDTGDADETDPGQAYLYINAQKPGVQVTGSGLQFEILEQGEGDSPSLTSTVVTHYHGTFPDGEVFDSSVDRGEPAAFPVNRVIAGWTEALQMMKEGDKWRLVIPPELAYGERGAGGGRIPPNAVLVFEVELIEVRD